MHLGSLNVIPSCALSLNLQDWEYRLCLQYWLALSMVEEGSRFLSVRLLLTPLEIIQGGCSGNGNRIQRHISSETRFFFSAAQSAALTTRKIPPSPNPRTCNRPSDVFLSTWKTDQPAALDVHAISTLVPDWRRLPSRKATPPLWTWGRWRPI